MAKKSAQSVISSYRKKQKSGPLLGIILAALLILAGIVIVIVWAVGNGGGGLHLFATKTPTPTETPTPTPVTPTATSTNTPTTTNTPTITPTPTASVPFEYVVQEDDNCTTIAEKFDVDIEVLLALNNLGSNCFIRVGDTIMIPAPGQQLPTATPLPTDILPGTKIEYKVRSGDTLSQIATRLNSTIERIIIETNKYRTTKKLALITDDNDILVGDILIVPVNIVTPVPSATATRTSTP
jgi:LysM repeat protein